MPGSDDPGHRCRDFSVFSRETPRSTRNPDMNRSEWPYHSTALRGQREADHDISGTGAPETGPAVPNVRRNAAPLKGVGRSHAAPLRELFEAGKKDAAKDSDIGLAVWHQSAYLVGTLYPGDRDTLAPLFDPDDTGSNHVPEHPWLAAEFAC